MEGGEEGRRKRRKSRWNVGTRDRQKITKEEKKKLRLIKMGRGREDKEGGRKRVRLG